LDGAELTEKFEQLGTSLESGADWDSAFLKITVLSNKLKKQPSCLAKQSALPFSRSGRSNGSRPNDWRRILQLETEPRGLADERFSEFLYDDESRYSRPDEGSTESVSSLTRSDVEQFYRSNYNSGARQ